MGSRRKDCELEFVIEVRQGAEEGGRKKDEAFKLA